MEKKKLRYIIAVITLVVGLGLTACTYFAKNIYQKDDVAVIVDKKIKDKLIEKNKDVYGNEDQTREQTLHLKVLSGKYQGKVFTEKNVYYPSQLVTQKYRAGQRVFVHFKKGNLTLVNPKRDWVLVLVATITIFLMVLMAGKHTVALLVSMALSWVIFYAVILLDVKLNGTQIVLLFGLADVVFSFISLLIVQGLNKKMLATWLAVVVRIYIHKYVIF